jgi:hypothetical protein
MGKYWYKIWGNIGVKCGKYWCKMWGNTGIKYGEILVQNV